MRPGLYSEASRIQNLQVNGEHRSGIEFHKITGMTVGDYNAGGWVSPPIISNPFITLILKPLRYFIKLGMFTAYERLRRHDRNAFFTVNDAFKPNVLSQKLIRPVNIVNVLAKRSLLTKARWLRGFRVGAGDRHEWHLVKALFRAMAVRHFLKQRAWCSEALIVLGSSFDGAWFAPVGTNWQKIVVGHLQQDLPSTRRLSYWSLRSIDCLQ